MSQPNRCLNFDLDVLPHLDAAYNLARWLTGNKQDAEDVVQEAFLRAFRFFGAFRGGNARAWLLAIVRNTCYTWIERNKAQQLTVEFDETLFASNAQADPEDALLQSEDQERVRFALEALPPGFREVLVLRELEGMSYREISKIMTLPAGTVMSRLSRARGELRDSLANLGNQRSSRFWGGKRTESSAQRTGAQF
jgi:RNA polymerase sigma-70 factor (ECF subfamily)